jgi:membrane protein DedA with SNARE-associated domain
MEELLSYLCEHAHHAHWVIFCLLLLSGFSLPISEDIMLLGGGAIASTCIPDHALKLYMWIFLGCYLSAWEAYWIGRLLGPRLYHMRFFKWIVTPQHLDTLQHYYSKFGIFTFIIGRFCPGGIRTALFMSSGLTHMPFPLFILRDGVACLISSSTLFYLGYHFARNIHQILLYFHRYSEWFIGLTSCLVLAGLAYLWYHHRSKQEMPKS